MQKLYTRLLSLSSTYSFGSLAQSAVAVVLLPVYTRYLSLADYGVLALMDLTILLISKLVEPPLANALSRFYYKPGYRERSGLLLFNLLLVLLLLALFLAAAYALAADLLIRLLFTGSPAMRPVVDAYAVILVLEVFSAFMLTYVRLRELARYFVFLSLSKLVLTTGLIVYLLAVGGLGVLGVVYGQMAGLAFLVVMTLPLLRGRLILRLAPGIVKEPLRFGYPMVVSGYSNLLLQSGDRYILNLFTSVSSVGLYSFGYKIASLLNVALIVPINQAIFPTIYQIEDNPARQKRFIAATATYYYVTAMFLGLCVSLLARELIMLLAASPDFWPAWIVVPVIAFSYVQLGLGRFFKWGALLRNRTTHLALMVLLSAAANLALTFVLVPLAGIMGAAFATLIAYQLWNALMLYYCRRFFDLHFELNRLAHVTVVGVGLYVLSLLVTNGQPLVAGLALKLLLAAAYPPLLMSTGFLNAEEKSHLRVLQQRAYSRLGLRLKDTVDGI